MKKTTNKYKVGDWVFFEHQLSYIKKMEGNKITNISNGVVEGYSQDFSDRVFPLTVNNKLISEVYEGEYERLRRECDFPGLNWPDIHRWFVQHWKDTCFIGSTNNKEEYYQARYQQVRDFVEQVKEKLGFMKMAEVERVKVIK